MVVPTVGELGMTTSMSMEGQTKLFCDFGIPDANQSKPKEPKMARLVSTSVQKRDKQVEVLRTPKPFGGYFTILNRL
ncbi:hypothetical protein FRX31_031833 [Thalictrum thalictroides]|uniref:Uncharacterized protein n=1 Tax=Thalictrum thalictroides TaxID=46969 RepID=A0A7J6V1J4_THATH|nr:hypothetical protein FRX31_031833 [Thalictrum thalictroides]